MVPHNGACCVPGQNFVAQHPPPQVRPPLPDFVPQDRSIGAAMLRQIFLRICRAIIVSDTDDRRRRRRAQISEQRMFAAAARAPAGKEIDKNGLATPIGRRLLLFLCLQHGKRRTPAPAGATAEWRWSRKDGIAGHDQSTKPVISMTEPIRQAGLQCFSRVANSWAYFATERCFANRILSRNFFCCMVIQTPARAVSKWECVINHSRTPWLTLTTPPPNTQILPYAPRHADTNAVTQGGVRPRPPLAQAAQQRAMHKLVEAYSRLVVAAAQKYRHYGLPLGDLMQEGEIGLLQAAARFEPERDIRFSTYATW